MTEVSRYASNRVRAYGSLAALALIGALASGRPELVALAAPFLAYLVIGLSLAREPDLSITIEVSRTRALEGDELPLALTIANAGAAIDLELTLIADTHMRISGDGAWSLCLGAGERRSLETSIRPLRWGVHGTATAYIEASDPLGLFAWRARAAAAETVRVYPRPEQLRRLIAPRQTQLLSGNRTARRSGDGIEFSEVRPFRPGDRPRRINWRATNRRGELHVNAQHAERNADVVLFIDTFEESRTGSAGTLDLALRAAASLAGGYLRDRDRVGVISFGGVMNWLEPSSGARSLYRIADALLQTEVVFSFVWKTLEVIPRKLLPPGVLVVGLTPLLDSRGVEALLDLRGRGYDVAIIELDPEPFLPAPSSRDAELARRLWRLQRAAIRRRFLHLGVSVSTWHPDQRLALPVGEVIESRRHVRTHA